MNNHKHSSFLLFFQRFCLKPLVAAVVIFISVYLASVIADQKLQSWYLKIPQTFSLYSAIKPADNRKISMLDGCFHIFLDIGANWAITTRKLFEPHLYPGSPSLTYFDKYFGPDRLEKLSTDPKYICVVGFEANPRHTKKLKEVERVYQKCGWNVKMMTETAIYDQKGAVVTFSQGSWPDQNRTDVVGTIINPKHWRFSNKKGYTASVPTIRLSDFFHEHILNRLPNKRQSELKEDPKIVGKIDCESCEVELLFDLMNNGLLIKFNYMIVEYHHATVLEKVCKSNFSGCFVRYFLCFQISVHVLIQEQSSIWLRKSITFSLKW